MSCLRNMTVLDAAREVVGNWKKFESFAWHASDLRDDPDNWTLTTLASRDSGLLEQSNQAAIEAEMAPFTEGDDPDVRLGGASHWLCGWVEGLEIRVYAAGGHVTPAFALYFELMERLEDYAYLDEEDYSRREYEATLKNIEEERPRDLQCELPDDWAKRVYTWLSENNDRAIMNRDDRGGYPSKDEIMSALYGLGLEPHPGTYPEPGDLVTVDMLSFHEFECDRGPVIWVRSGEDWVGPVRFYCEENEVVAWFIHDKDGAQKLELD